MPEVTAADVIKVAWQGLFCLSRAITALYHIMAAELLSVGCTSSKVQGASVGMGRAGSSCRSTMNVFLEFR